MKSLKSVLGYTIAVLMIFVVMVTFIGIEGLGQGFVKATGIVISPDNTGGQVVKVIEHNDYKTKIHEPVFVGLFKPSKEGFIQIDWEYADDNGLTDIITENIDYDMDGKDDFQVVYDTINDKADLLGYNSKVVSIEDTYKLKKGYAVRVKLISGK